MITLSQAFKNPCVECSESHCQRPQPQKMFKMHVLLAVLAVVAVAVATAVEAAVAEASLISF